MTSDPVQTNEIAETFNELAHDRCCKYKSKGLTASSEVLLGLLTESGLVGKTVLDIGCGTGFFALETLRQGASSCMGVDLSSAAIHEANDDACSLLGYSREQLLQMSMADLRPDLPIAMLKQSWAAVAAHPAG